MYATGQLIHERRQNKQVTELMKELELYSTIRMIWKRYGHVRITYVKCYKHSFTFPFNYPPCYGSHNKIYVNYKKPIIAISITWVNTLTSKQKGNVKW